MWIAYKKAYGDIGTCEEALLHPENSGARILMIAGDEDECWPSEYSIRFLENKLKTAGYQRDVKVIIYRHGSHLNGLMPNREREKRLYRMIPLIGLMYRTFGRYRKQNLAYFEKSEKEIIEWIGGRGASAGDKTEGYGKDDNHA